MTDPRPVPELRHGASWLTGDEELIPVPGFHEDWIRSHRELVGEAKNVCDVVLGLGWISVSVFSEGYVELLVPNRRDPALRERIGRLLRGNGGRWRKALVMSMDEEGYASVGSEDLEAPGRLEALLAGATSA